MKQIKDAIKNNAILLTGIDLIGIILYLMLMKKICNVDFTFNLYDFSIIWVIMAICYSKNKSKEVIRIIDKILEKDSKNEKNNIR
mgnify:CR=1 FL=1